MPLNLKKSRSCGNECSCSLCRELQDPANNPTPLGFFRGRSEKKKTNSKKKLKGAPPPPEPPNDNFILKRSIFDFRQMSMMELNGGSNIKKSLSYQEISKKLEASLLNHQNKQKVYSTSNLINDPLAAVKSQDHRTVIYFGDSIRKNDETKGKLIKVDSPRVEDSYRSRRLCEELQFSYQNSVRKSQNFSALCQKAENFVVRQKSLRPNKPAPPPPPVSSVALAEKNVVNQLKITLNENKTKPTDIQQIIKVEGKEESFAVQKQHNLVEVINNESASLPSFVESVINGVINIRIEDNYEVASKIVQSVHEKGSNNRLEFFEDDDLDEDDFDWSFVQEWRTR